MHDENLSELFERLERLLDRIDPTCPGIMQGALGSACSGILFRIQRKLEVYAGNPCLDAAWRLVPVINESLDHLVQDYRISANRLTFVRFQFEEMREHVLNRKS